MPLSSIFNDALLYAADVHRHQFRKETSIPYLSHLLAVCGAVLEHGGSEEEVIAALLHDALEDQPRGGRTKAEIRDRFGDRVLKIVEECSDTEEEPKPPWRERKQRYIAHLPASSPSAQLVSACDELHNIRAIARDLKDLGPGLWSRFNAGPEDTLWYYRSLLEAYRKTGAPPAAPGRSRSAYRRAGRVARQTASGALIDPHGLVD